MGSSAGSGVVRATPSAATPSSTKVFRKEGVCHVLQPREAFQRLRWNAIYDEFLANLAKPKPPKVPQEPEDDGSEENIDYGLETPSSPQTGEV